VTVGADSKVELNEAFDLVLSALSAGGREVTFAGAGATESATADVDNDDSATLTVGDATVVEGDVAGDNRQLMFPVTLDNPIDANVSVDFSTQDDTAEDENSDADYESTSGTLTINAGDLSGQIVVNITEDTTVELDETMQVVLNGLSASNRDVALVGTGTLGGGGGNPGVFTLFDSGGFGAQNFIGRPTIGDVDGDGDPDAFIPSQPNTPSGDQLWINQGGAQAGAPGDFEASNQVLSGYSGTSDNNVLSAAEFGDLDGDGDLDVFVARASHLTGAANVIYVNQGGLQGGTEGVLQLDGQTLGSSSSNSVALGDIDNDGDLDAFVGNYLGVGLGDSRFWVNQGGLQGGTQGQFQIGAGPFDVRFHTHRATFGDFDGDSDLDVITIQSNGQSIRLLVNQGGAQGGTLGQFVRTGLQNEGGDLATGDFDGDGDLDIYAAGFTTTKEGILVNQGGAQAGTEGTFVRGANLSTNSLDGPGVDAGDIDGDGDLDIVKEQSVFFNQGGDQGGTEGDFVGTPRVGSGSGRWLILADLDGDTDPDIFQAGQGGSALFGVFLNEGVPAQGVTATGTIENDDSAEVSITGESKSEGTGGTTTFTFDIDLSAPVDAAVSMTADTANGSATATDDFSAVTGATVSFAAGSTTTQTVDVTVGADSKVELNEAFDLVLSALSAGGREVTFAGAGATESATADVENDDSATLSVGDATVVEGDVAGDNRQLMFPVTLDNPIDANVSVDFSTQDDTAEDENGDADYESTSGTLTINAGDLSGQIVVNITEDDKVELDETMLVVLDNLDASNRSVDVSGTGTLPGSGGTPASFIDSGQAFVSGNTTGVGVEMADFDGDNDLDIVLIYRDTTDNLVLLNDGAGNFTLGQTFGIPGPTDNRTRAAVGDVNGDDAIDIVVGNSTIGPNVWINDGTGNFSLGSQIVVPFGFGAHGTLNLELGDLDGDLDLDVFIAGIEGGGDEIANTVYFNDGNGNFTDSGQLLGNFRSNSVDLGDLDGDGDLDAFVANGNIFGNEPNNVWLNDGTGTFTLAQSIGSAQFLDAQLSDLDGDGDQDAFVSVVNGSNRVYLNDGTGSFTDTGQNVGAGASTYLDLGDLDNDGDVDAFLGRGVQRVFLNDGAGNFTTSAQVFPTDITIQTALGDVDSDGDLDAVWANAGSSSRLYLNQSPSAAVTVTGTIENDDSAPVADAGGPYTIDEGDGLSLDASASTDADSASLTYRWDVDGDSDFDENVTGETPTLTAAQMAALGLNDDASITVTVEASDGTNIDTATASLTINSVDPDFEAGANETLLPPVVGLFTRTGITFTDPGADSWTGTVNFGEPGGLNESLTINQTPKSFDLNHIYINEGTFTVAVTVNDDDGGSHVDTFDVTVVLNEPPTANAGGPYTVGEGATVVLDGSGSSDPDQTTATLMFEWDLDGDSVFGETGAAAGRGDEVGIAPTFSAAGLDGFVGSTFTVGLRVTDDHNESDNDTATINIDNLDPTANNDAFDFLEDDASAIIDLLANDTDPAGANDPLTITSVDDSSTTGTVTLSGGQVSYSPDGFFEALGAGQVALDSLEYTISDGDGGTDTAQVEVTVHGQNDAPTVANTITDVEVNQNAADSVIDLAGVFADIDTGDTVTPSAASSDGGIVAVSVVGNSLTLDYQPNQSGTVTITVTGTDSQGAAVDTTLQVTVRSPADQVTNLVAIIEQYNDDGKLNNGQTNALTKKLDNALKSIDKGNLTAAVNQIEAFQNQVAALVNSGALSEEEGDLLTDLADDLIDSLSV